MRIDTRSLKGDVAYRALEDGPGHTIGVITGMAPVFNTYSADMGGFVEMVEPDAVTRSLTNGSDVMGRFEHRDLLGRTAAGTTRLERTDSGVRYEIDVPNTTQGRDVATMVDRGDVRGSSFAFRVDKTKAEWRQTDNGYPLRVLTAVPLIDVGPVTVPAYPDSPAQMRAALECFVTDERSLDDVAHLVDAGRLAELIEERNALIASPDTDPAASDTRTRDITVRHHRLRLLELEHELRRT